MRSVMIPRAGFLASSFAALTVACVSGRSTPEAYTVSPSQWDRATACISSYAEAKGYGTRTTDSSIVVWTSARQSSPSVAPVPREPRVDLPGQRASPNRPERVARSSTPPISREELVLARDRTADGYQASWHLQAIDSRGARVLQPVSRKFAAIQQELDRTCLGELAALLRRGGHTQTASDSDVK